MSISAKGKEANQSVIRTHTCLKDQEFSVFGESSIFSEVKDYLEGSEGKWSD